MSRSGKRLLGNPRQLIRLLLLAAATTTLYSYLRSSVLAASRADLPLERVAHGAGGMAAGPRTNSLQALKANAANFNLFELDFSLTSDGHPVCMHDWQRSAEQAFGHTIPSPPTLAEFERISAGAKYTPCTAASLINWLRKHPDKRIVTDVKNDNLAVLAYFARHYPAYLPRFVPQIYAPTEYAAVKALGYEAIILTLYRWNAKDDEVLRIAPELNLYAVTMPVARVPKLAASLGSRNVKTYAHTVNTPEELRQVFDQGVSEIYTDWLKSPAATKTPALAVGQP